MIPGQARLCRTISIVLLMTAALPSSFARAGGTDRLDASFLRHTVELFRAKNWETLRGLATTEPRGAERTVAGYFYSLSGRPDAESVFFEQYTRDGQELWKLASSESSWKGICRASERTRCDSGIELAQLHSLALLGEPRAIRTFLESWVAQSDASLAETIDEDYLPPLLERRPVETVQAAEQTTPEVRDKLVMALECAVLRGKRALAVARRIQSNLARTPLRDRILDALRKTDCDWP
jgi:hypothetical protein